MDSAPAGLRPLVVIVPVLDDWACLAILAERLRAALAPAGWTPRLVAVDDGSREPPAAAGDAGAAVLVQLARNVGHQRAIAIGLDHALRESGADVIAIMDADGEDRPEDLPRLLAALGDAPARIAVASRGRRREGLRFRVFYGAYKAAFRAATGERLDFGNFCVMGRAAALRLVAMHELWLNLPATVMRSRLDLVRVPADRGERYLGRSRMNFVALVMHGLSAVGVFSERAFTRMLVAVGCVASLLVLGLAAALALKAMDMATPGWVTTIAAALVVVLVQTAIVALSGLFMVFGDAANVAMSPASAARRLVARVDGRISPCVVEAAAPDATAAGLRPPG